MIVECRSRVAGMVAAKQTRDRVDGAGPRSGPRVSRSSASRLLTKKCVHLVCMRDHYFGYIMDNIAATKVPPEPGAFAVRRFTVGARPPRHDPKWPYSLSNSHVQHPARADTCAEKYRDHQLVELDLVLAVGDRVHVHRDEDEAANYDGEDGRDVKRHRLGGEGVARLLLQRLERNLLLLDPATGNMGARV